MVSLHDRIEALRCKACGGLTDTPLNEDEEARVDALLNAIKEAINAAPPEYVDRINEAGKKVRRYRDILFIDRATTETFIAEVCDQM